MNLEKLKPWNWFKHEESSDKQIPVRKNDPENTIDQSHAVTSEHPIGSLFHMHQEMERLFDNIWQSFGVTQRRGLSYPTSLVNRGLFEPPGLNVFQAKLDVSGNASEYDITVDLPGLSQGDVELQLTGNRLTVKGNKEETNEVKEKHFYCIERSVGAFQRTLSLPEDADTEAIKATMSNGVLHICIPRKEHEEEPVKRISISS